MTKEEILVFVFRDRSECYVKSVGAGLDSLLSKHPLLSCFGSSKKVDTLRFTDSEEFSTQIAKYKKLRGLVLDSSFFFDYSASVYKVISSFENLGLPTLRFSHSFISDLPEERQLFKMMWDAFAKALALHEPRQLRSENRKSLFSRLNLNAGSSQPNTDSSSSVKVVTSNISLSGCFVVHCDPPCQVGDIVRLGFEGFPVVIEAKACWLTGWGGPQTRLPGIGLKFQNDSDEFRMYLSKLLSEASA